MNIFVSKSGDFKLGNFSTASSHDSTAILSPEAYKGNSCDSAIDIYSLGIVMYKLLNRGRLPFLPLPPSPVTIEDTEESILCIMSGKEMAPPVDT